MNVKQQEKAARIILWASGSITVSLLFIIIGYILKEGLTVISVDFLFDYPRKMGAEGGIFPSIIGTIYLMAVTILFAVLVGVGGAIYLNEYTRQGQLSVSSVLALMLWLESPQLFLDCLDLLFL